MKATSVSNIKKVNSLGSVPMVDAPDKTTCQTVDPWQPIPAVAELFPVLPTMAESNYLQPSLSSLDSDRYLSLIESKLNRLKGVNGKKDPVAKDMISSLDKVRLCHMRMLTDVDLSSPYIRNCDYVDDSTSSPTVVDILKRKIAPERQALNEEELKNLVDNDELHLTAAMLEQTLAQPAKSAWPDADAETVPPVNDGASVK